MLPEELSKVKIQPNATVHFPNVTSLTIPQRLINVLSGKILTKIFNIFYINIHTIDNIQCYIINKSIFFRNFYISSQVKILKDV